MSETKNDPGSKPKEIIIYSKDYCPYCDRAKEFFAQRGLTYREIDVAVDPKAYQELKARTHHMTVPQIFFDELFVGGYTDLIEKVEAGQFAWLKP
jgi:GrxC family glutaredoxin